MKSIPVLAIFILFSAAAFCLGQSDMSITEITYEYMDSSVPPRYHRSYTITVKPDSIRIVVDSYGDVLADKTWPLKEGVFPSVIDSFKTNGLKTGRERKDQKGCTGGTGERVVCYGPSGIVFSAAVYHCGGEDYGDLYGNTSAFAADIKKLIPDFNTLIRS